MVKFRPQDMLLVYALINVLLCIVVVCFGGWTGLYAMLGISFFMSIMYPTQFSLALTDLGNNTKKWLGISSYGHRWKCLLTPTHARSSAEPWRLMTQGVEVVVANVTPAHTDRALGDVV